MAHLVQPAAWLCAPVAVGERGPVLEHALPLERPFVSPGVADERVHLAHLDVLGLGVEPSCKTNVTRSLTLTVLTLLPE